MKLNFNDIPKNIQLLLNSYNDKNNYVDMEKLKQKLLMLGYIMDYDLNCEITHLFKVEDYINTNYIKDLELENIILSQANNNLLHVLNKIHHKDLLDVTNKKLEAMEKLNIEYN